MEKMKFISVLLSCGLSEAYADSAWLTQNEDQRMNGAVSARIYIQRFTAFLN
jgi:hypothetical protein